MKFRPKISTVNTILFIIMVIVLIAVFTPNSWKQNIAQRFQYTSSEKVKKGNPNDAPPEFATVTGIIDAITFTIDSGQTVRYLGVRAPSVGETVECFGKEAVQANESVLGKKVRLEEDPTLTRAQDGAWVRYVYLQLDPQDVAREQKQAETPAPSTTPTPDASVSPSPTPNPTPTPTPPTEIFINDRILAGGFGFPVVSQEMKSGESLLSSARFASATGKGLWGKCKVSNDNNVFTTNTETSCLIKGKVTADLQKIYRTPDCGGYSQTTVLQSQGGQWFCAEDIAKDAGFTRASDCPISSSPTPQPSATP